MLNDENRKKLDDIVANMASQNAPQEDVQAIVSDFTSKYDTPQSPAQQPQEQTEYQKNGVVGSLFPATTQATERGGNFLSRAVAGAGDVLTLPARAGSAVGTGLGTLAGGGSLKQASDEAINDLSRNKSEEKGALGFAQNALYDPTSSPLLMGAGKVAQGGKAALTLGEAALKTGLQGAAYGAGSSAYQQAENGDIDPVKTAEAAGVGLATGAATTGLGGLAKKGVGEGLENLGKTVKGGELKITNAIAKKSYGADLMEKKQTIINDAAEFGVTHGNNEDGAADALAKASQRFDKADEIGTALAADPNTPKLNPAEVAMNGIDLKLAPTGKRKQAAGIIDNVLSDMADDGHDQPVTLDQLIQAKKNLNADGKLFANGPGSDADVLDRTIRQKMYLNIVDAIGEISPEIKSMNTEGKRLLDVNAAFSNAASRNANHDAAGLTDFILGGASIAHPGSLAVTAPLFVTKKLTGNGRAGNFLINTGRGLQGKTDNSIDATLANLKPESGETPLNVDLPDNVNTPTYFRKGIRPETTSLSDAASQAGVKYAGVQDGGKLGDLYNFHDPKTGSDFYTRSAKLSDITDALQNMRKKWEAQE